MLALLAIVILSCTCGYHFIYKPLRSSLSSVPSPAYTLFTSLWLKCNEIGGNRRLYIHQLHQTYGPTVRIGPKEVSFSNVEAMKEIYMSSGSGYDKTEFYDLFCQFEHRTMFSTLNKSHHSQMRRRLTDHYAMTNVVRPDILHGIQHNAQTFTETCMQGTGQSIDVYELLHCYALDCVTHHLFGSKGTNSVKNQKDLDLMKELCFDNRLPFRFLQYYSPRLSTYVEYFFPGKNMRKSEDYVLQMTTQTNGGTNTLTAKLHAKSTEIKPIEIAAECMDHMFAGIDTTGDGLCFLMWQLSQPEYLSVQERLHSELIQNPDMVLESLTYLDAVVKEGLRCFPPIPMSLPRYVPTGGRVINGFYLPGGTIVSCQAYSLHLLNENVFPEPERFWPERWLAEEGTAERNRLFFSFAAGGRGCVGKNLAMVEMKILLRGIYLRFRTRASLDMKADMTMDDQVILTRPKDQICLLDFHPITG